MISVILPTFNPKINTLLKTISGLKTQTLPLENWELIIIDNNSSIVIDIDLSWHPTAKMVKQPIPGLTFARIAGFEQATGELIVMVDDDNILAANYLENVASIFASNEKLGAISGKSVPLFENVPPYWINQFYANLALRDLGELEITEDWKNSYPSCAPIGAGMAIKTLSLESFLANNATNNLTITDRVGNSLASGGDNDVVIEVLKSGFKVGYFPQLTLTHLIPIERLQLDYFARLLKDSNKSWIMVLEKHKINPWPKIPQWSVPFRKLKSWFKNAAWKNEVNYLKWKASCGYYEGLSK